MAGCLLVVGPEVGISAEGGLSADGAEADINARARMVIESSQLSGEPRNHPKYRTYDYLGRAAHSGCLNQEEFNKLLGDLDEAAWGSGDNSARIEQVFALPPITRYALQFSACLSQPNINKLKDALRLPRLVLDHGTINHWSMRASSIFLLSEKYPDLVWNDISTGRHIPAADMIKELRPLLIGRFFKFFEDGNAEQFSPVYQAINFFSVLNLVEFSADEEIRSLAEKSAIVMLATMRGDSFHGQFVPPLTRANFRQRSGLSTKPSSAHVAIQFMLWFYFGEPRVTSADLKDRVEPFFPIMFALSRWRPPVELLTIGKIIPPAYDVTTITPTFSKWNLPTRDYVYGSAYITDRYAIGVGNGYVKPADYNGSNQFFGVFLKSTEPENAIECYHPYWFSNSGEDAWKSDRSSPFQQQWHQGRQAVIITDIPQADPWPKDLQAGWGRLRAEHALDLIKVLKCRIPKSETAFVRTPNSIMLNWRGTFVGIKIVGASWSLDEAAADASLVDFRVLKVLSSSAAVYFELATSDQVEWESFVHQFPFRSVTFDPRARTVRFDTEGRGQLRVTFGLSPADDGWIRSVPQVELERAPLQISTKLWFNSPFLEVGGGQFWLKTAYGAMEISEQSGRLELSRKYCGSTCSRQ
ncbi:hypothetical protein IVA79_15165 [Bradyrhizobium sp. 138]|uniref:hypothetical protein n=1 Tax=Bradyrhizobium sp. 138 TaxID=2782615 RepID=UPI001FF95F9A|nr:hypothetical protein [Bradyrhizobium sp. 138]MCK1735277.1 hypothetical protein [Bradyrhizobium sp. 138]